MSPLLLTHLLDLLFQDPSAHRPVKDRLSDWILDQHASEHRLDGQALLEHLRTVHPRIFERLRVNPQVKDEIERVLAAQQPKVGQPNQTAPSCVCGAPVAQEVAEYSSKQFGEVICVACQQRRFGTTSRSR